MLLLLNIAPLVTILILGKGCIVAAQSFLPSFQKANTNA
jgi:hypothetical protein